jgi:hypothetical protein
MKNTIIENEKGIPDTSDKSVYYPFGRFLINVALLKKNTLRVIYGKSYINVSGIKTTLISNEVKYILLDLVNYKKMNQSDYNNLNADDKLLLNNVLRKSKVAEILNLELKDPLDEKIKRWEMISASLLAGNNNPTLIGEAKDILKVLLENDRISQPKFKSLMLELNSI